MQHAVAEETWRVREWNWRGFNDDQHCHYHVEVLQSGDTSANEDNSFRNHIR